MAYYEMNNGLVVMQAEEGEFVYSSNSSNGKWKETKQFAGEEGSVMLWTGDDYFANNNAGKTQTAPLEYTFEIDTPGTYYISMRAIRPDTGEENDRNNDFFVQFEDEGYKKIYFNSGNQDNVFKWAKTYDHNHQKPAATFNVTQSEINANDGIFTLNVAARSHMAGFDEIHIKKGSVSQDADAPTSRLINGDAPSDPPEPVDPPEDNDAPIARNDTASTDHDKTVTVNVLGNDSDPDGDNITLDSVSYAGSTSQVSIVNGKIVVNPLSSATQERVETIQYTISDSSGEKDTATLQVTVGAADDDEPVDDTPPPSEPSNSAPVAVDDAASTAYNKTISVDVLGNDKDADNDDLKITNVSYSGDTSVVSIVGGEIQVNPLSKATDARVEEITYTVSDGNGGTDEGTLSVSIGAKGGDSNPTPPPTPTNEAPVARDDTADTSYNTTILVDVLDNDSDPEGGPLTLVSASYNGTSSLVSVDDGMIKVNPLKSFDEARVEVITYTVADAEGAESTAVLRVNVEDPDSSTTTPVAESLLNFFIADATTNETLKSLKDGDQIDRSELSDNVTFFATSDDADAFKFVELTFDGFTTRESIEPFALFGDMGGDFNRGLDIDPGELELLARGYGDSNELVEEVLLNFDFV